MEVPTLDEPSDSASDRGLDVVSSRMKGKAAAASGAPSSGAGGSPTPLAGLNAPWAAWPASPPSVLGIGSRGFALLAELTYTGALSPLGSSVLSISQPNYDRRCWGVPLHGPNSLQRRPRAQASWISRSLHRALLCVSIGTPRERGRPPPGRPGVASTRRGSGRSGPDL